jgi:hypothetical protein
LPCGQPKRRARRVLLQHTFLVEKKIICPQSCADELFFLVDAAHPLFNEALLDPKGSAKIQEVTLMRPIHGNL